MTLVDYGAAWAKRFNIDLQHLELSIRSYNALARLASCDWRSSDRYFAMRHDVFGLDGRLLAFNEWVLVAKQRERALINAPNIGVKSVEEIFCAIDKYITEQRENSHSKATLLAEIELIEERLAILKKKVIDDPRCVPPAANGQVGQL